MKKIKRALISVSNKKNLKPLLKVLKKNKVEIISSGGTFKEIKRLKFKCIEISKYTGSNEILNGRVKTLHPKIHAGILNKRNNKMKIDIISDNSLIIPEYIIDIKNKSKKTIELIEHFEKLKNLDQLIIKNNIIELKDKKKFKKKTFRKKKFYKKAK